MDKQTIDLMLNNRRAVSLKKYKEYTASLLIAESNIISVRNI